MINMYNCDCMDFMNKCKDNQYDIAIVDPPYGIGFDNEKIVMSAGIRKDGTQRKMKSWKNPKPKNYLQKEWDNKKPGIIYFNELFRISKFQIISGANYFTDILPVSGGWIVWEKGVPEQMSLSQAELLWNNIKNSIKIVKILWAGFKKINKEKRIHICQKPVALYKWLLQNYAKEGDKIIDTHGGSGSICIACDELGYDLDWMEKDQDYYNDACNRFKEYKQNIKIYHQTDDIIG